MDVKDLESNAWFRPLLQDVQREFDRLMLAEHDQRPALQQELQALERNISGWSASLANPSLGAALRLAIEVDWEQALARKQRIEHQLEGHDRRLTWLRSLLDPQKVVDCLNRLDDVLGSANATRGNLELSLHIDSIACFSDGKVVMRTSKLGALAGVAGILRDPGVEIERDEEDCAGKTACHQATPRRRQVLQVDSLDGQGDELEAAAHLAADPRRFAGLPEDWFWEDVFQIPRRMCWSEQHALDVAEYRLLHRASIKNTAAHFDKAPQTIREALKCAQAHGIDATGETMNLPRSHGWAISNAADVQAFVIAQGCTEGEAARHFGVSETTIARALKHAGSMPASESDAE
ncbi:MAG: hypothetical protein HY290_03670 [Planctomycetia bacterium]|nr:hypothetical protein [Planctomycetia bacterium]